MYCATLSPELKISWQSSLEQLCLATQSNGRLLILDRSMNWSCFCECNVSATDNGVDDDMLLATLREFRFPHLDVLVKTKASTTLYLAPIWGGDDQLSAVLALSPATPHHSCLPHSYDPQHSNSQHGKPQHLMASVAGQVSFDMYVRAQKNSSNEVTVKKQGISIDAEIASSRVPTLQEFIDALDDHTWVKNADGRYVMINHSVEKAWDYSCAQVHGKTDEELFESERAEQYITADKTVIDADQQVTIEECPVLDEQQNKIWLETIKSPIRDNSGSLVGVLGMTRNVTRRKVVETWLSVTSEIFNNFQEGMFITDDVGNILDVNSAFVRITGYELSDVIGMNPRFLQSGHHDITFYQGLWEKLMTDGQWRGEFINRKKDGSIYPQMTTISVLKDEDNTLMHHICVFEDISDQKADEESLRRMAFYDPLTNLPNRAHLSSLLEQHIDLGRKYHKSFATLFLDLDHFKHINDSKGHLYGDQLLEQVAQRLNTVLEHRANIARLGGDEFVVVLSDFNSEAELLDTIDGIMGVFNSSFVFDQNESLRVSASIGVALYPKDGHDSETLLKNADTAMYLAKKNGRNGYAFYSPDLTKSSVLHVRIQSALHEALEKNQFYLVYQPQYSLADNRLIGVEALLRWQHPDLGLIPPSSFIPIAEKTGLIQKIGAWVLRESCLQGNRWLAEGRDFGRIAVNVSALQLQNSDFFPVLEAVLEETGFPAKRLDIEITETFLLFNPEKAIATLEQLSSLGIEISLDDFGTGYSSLSYLKGLPINKLKIDQSFVKDVPDNNDSNAIVNAIVAMGQALCLKVVAEGVESSQQSEYLKQKGCEYGQGYLFSKPQRPERLFI
ncbi:EAL domain-containing protein [Vibrio sp. ZSDZ65]|uniref:cyclic-guanylate-specific phosphodiesterase n=1 Tax=Vibrio qingdaonensis TaxID=2829491 RepID=A0A9X3HWZ8_9VIBR|nr:bifunctional diguanylate cyclase/phosphodiesterase [Vibrio qingdaonensis]MCW8346804.1 EAL domain-containing protein [Vibrio qingdaonensis]